MTVPSQITSSSDLPMHFTTELSSKLRTSLFSQLRRVSESTTGSLVVSEESVSSSLSSIQSLPPYTEYLSEELNDGIEEERTQKVAPASGKSSPVNILCGSAGGGDCYLSSFSSSNNLLEDRIESCADIKAEENHSVTDFNVQPIKEFPTNETPTLSADHQYIDQQEERRKRDEFINLHNYGMPTLQRPRTHTHLHIPVCNQQLIQLSELQKIQCYFTLPWTPSASTEYGIIAHPMTAITPVATSNALTMNQLTQLPANSLQDYLKSRENMVSPSIVGTDDQGNEVQDVNIDTTPIRPNKLKEGDKTKGESKKRKSQTDRSDRRPQKRYTVDPKDQKSNEDNLFPCRSGRIPLTTNVAREVEALDPETRRRLYMFTSCSEAARAMGINRTKMSRSK